MKKLLIIAVAAFALYSCGSNQSSSKSDSTSTKSDSATTKPVEAKPESPWVYSSETDKMTSKTNYYAVVTATNKLELEAPYDGGTVGSITIRKQGKENEVVLTVNKGQFLGGEGHNVNVRFDNDPAISFISSEPSDGSTTVLFLENEAKFIKNIKKAKKMLVQAEFYESGTKEMEFDVAGFKWDH